MEAYPIQPFNIRSNDEEELGGSRLVIVFQRSCVCICMKPNGERAKYRGEEDEW
jgi:hypothetical protein